MEETKFKKNNRITIVAFLALFTLPVIFAWTAYFSGWFEGASTTNNGEWVDPVLAFEALNPIYSGGEPLILEPGETWKLILPAKVANCQDEQVDSSCMLNLFLMGQTHMALGKESKRVERILLNGADPYNEQQLQAVIERFVDLKVVNGEAETTSDLSQSYIYIADPVGNIILRYPLVESQENVFMVGKDILKDLKKLLKLSRLG